MLELKAALEMSFPRYANGVNRSQGLRANNVRERCKRDKQRKSVKTRYCYSPLYSALVRYVQYPPGILKIIGIMSRSLYQQVVECKNDVASF